MHPTRPYHCKKTAPVLGFTYRNTKSTAHYFRRHLVRRALLHRPPVHLPRGGQGRGPDPAICTYGKTAVVRHHLAQLYPHPAVWHLPTPKLSPPGRPPLAPRQIAFAGGPPPLPPQLRPSLPPTAGQALPLHLRTAPSVERGGHRVFIRHRLRGGS